jgi:exopolysaccharide production protein ExoY
VPTPLLKEAPRAPHFSLRTASSAGGVEESQWFAATSEVPEQFLRDKVGGADRLVGFAGRCAALLLLVGFSPLLLGIAALVRLDGGPATFSHYRVGRGGRLFPCMKFRTMRQDAEQVLQAMLERDPALRAEWARAQKLQNDPRVTAVGRWLRRWSLDELPQLVNVVRGEMALVGPRPITVPELRRYSTARWKYLAVPPGMTGLWQVSGRNGTTYTHRVQLDAFYAMHRSAALDLQILVRTVAVVLTRQGAV